MIPRLSVAILICTRDRPWSLERALEALRRCSIPAQMQVEAVIVDNASTSDIGPIVATFAETWPYPVRTTRELRQGLAAARNAGVRMIESDWIVMTDDDCLFAPDYFSALQHLLDLQGPPLLIIGGRVLLADKTDLPVTIKEDDVPAVMSREDHPAAFLQGCNMCIGRQAIQRIGEFDERFGAGARFRSAEDTEYLYRAARAGVPVRYDPSLVIYHAHGRKSSVAVSNLYCSYQYGNAAFCTKLALSGDRNGFRYLYWDLKDIFYKRTRGFESHIKKRRRLVALVKGVLDSALNARVPGVRASKNLDGVSARRNSRTK